MVTIMLFFLYLVPFIWPFGCNVNPNPGIGAAYACWYVMLFILTLVWGHVVVQKGCWFFDKRN